MTRSYWRGRRANLTNDKIHMNNHWRAVIHYENHNIVVLQEHEITQSEITYN